MWINRFNTYDQIDYTLRTIGIEPPTGAERAVGVRNALRQFMEDGDPFLNPAELTPETVIDAVLDVATRIAARDHAITKAQGYVEDHARDAQRAVYEAAAPGLIGELDKHLQRELANLEKAAQHLEVDDTPESVIDRGGRAIAAWKNRAAVDQVADRLDSIRDALTRLAPILGVTGPTILWLTGCTDAEQYDRLAALWETDGLGRGWLAVQRAGANLRISDPTELTAHQERLAESRQQWLEAQVAAQRAALPDDGFIRGTTIAAGDVVVTR